MRDTTPRRPARLTFAVSVLLALLFALGLQRLMRHGAPSPAAPAGNATTLFLAPGDGDRASGEAAPAPGPDVPPVPVTPPDAALAPAVPGGVRPASTPLPACRPVTPADGLAAYVASVWPVLLLPEPVASLVPAASPGWVDRCLRSLDRLAFATCPGLGEANGAGRSDGVWRVPLALSSAWLVADPARPRLGVAARWATGSLGDSVLGVRVGLPLWGLVLAVERDGAGERRRQAMLLVCREF